MDYKLRKPVRHGRGRARDMGNPFHLFRPVFGIINAINLIDGVNGLACGVASIAFASFAVFAYLDNDNIVFYLSLVSLGATLGLFKYNYPDAKIFMGDSGSLFLGFSLAVMSILLTQGKGNAEPMVPVMVLGIPIFDTVRVMIVRAINRKNPFSGDRTHLHHLLLRSGTPPTRVVKIIWAMSFFLSLLAFLLRNQDSWLMLIIYADIAVVMGILIESLKIAKTRRKQQISDLSS